MGVAYHQAGLWSRTELNSALGFRDKLAHIAAEFSQVVNRSLEWYLVASIIVGCLAKGMEHLVWSFVWCFVAISVISLCQAFVQRSLMEVARSVDGFSSKLDRSLGVKRHSSSLLVDGTDHSLSDSIPVVRVRRARCVCHTAGSEHWAEGLVVVLPSAIIAPKPSDLIAQSSDSGLKGPVGGGASFRLHIWEHPYKCEAGIVVNE